MTDSYVAWVDYSAAEQERIRQALALFKDTETLDELGLGRIRDALANLLFPGTSTIQTRLRYFLIVPWIYQDLDRRRGVTSATVGQLVDRAERALIEPLKEEAGAFGGRSGPAVKRLPSGVYWGGLRTWKIFRGPPEWSQVEFHVHWDEIREHNRRAVPDDGGVAPDHVRVWDPRLPASPVGWRGEIDLEVTHAEATYLRGRMESCAGSLLAHLAAGNRPRLDVAAPWEAADGLPPRLATMVRQAKAFSVVMRGAVRLYNLELCRASQLPGHRERIGGHEEQMEAWADEAATLVESWRPEELWAFLAESAAEIPPAGSDRAFVDRWCEVARGRGLRALAQDTSARTLIVDRECQVKGVTRARFQNPNALARWGGESGTGFIDYRWFRVRKLLEDLHDGLDRKTS